MQRNVIFEQFLARRRVQMTPPARVLHACVRLACLGVTGGEERPSPAAAAALPPADRVNDLRAPLATVTDWDALRQAAIDHGLSALLYRQISAYCPESVPPASLDALKSLYLASAQRALRMTRQLVQVLAVLEEAGIGALPLKGPALSQSAFGDPSLRHFVDLDVLVRPGDAPAARDAIVADGFEQCPPAPDATAPISLDWPDIGFRDPRTGLLLELHWQLRWATPEFSRLAPTVIDRAVDLELLGRRVLEASPEDALLLLAAHNPKHGWEQLEAVAAFGALMTRYDADVDWELALSRATQVGCRRRLAVGTLLTCGLGGLPLPAQIQSAATRDPAARHLATEAHRALSRVDPPRRRDDICRIFWTPRLEDDSRAVRRALWARIVAPTDDDRADLTLPRVLRGLDYMWRPIRLLWKYAREQRTRQ